MAHFARELDEAAAEDALAAQGDGALDVRVIACAVAGGYGGNHDAVDAVTAWIAETIRRDVPHRRRPRPHPAGARPRRREPQRAARSGMPMALTSATRVAVITGRRRCSSSPAMPASGHCAARRTASMVRPADITPAAELPACMND